MPTKMINAIPWELLNHAYGPADDIPAILNAIVADDPERRAAARFALTGNAYHQGTRYPATYPTCQVLCHLVRQTATPEKDQLWELIRVLSIDGSERGDAPDRHAIARQLAWKLSDCDDSGIPDLDHDWAIHDCYLVLTAMVPELLSAIRQSADDRLSVSAAYVLAFLPWHGWCHAGELMDIALNDRRQLDVRASCLLTAIGLSSEQRQRVLDWSISQSLLSQISDIGPLNRLELALLSGVGKPLPECLEPLGQRYVEYGSAVDATMYPERDTGNIEDYRPDRIPPVFPWGDLTYELRWLRDDKGQGFRESPDSNALPGRLRTVLAPGDSERFDPDRHKVTPNDFSEANVRRAVMRYHYNRFCGGRQLSDEHYLFGPFVPFVPELAWPVVRSLLDHADEANRSCATNWCSNLRDLHEDQIDELFDRVIEEDRKDLCSILSHQNITRRHSLRIMEALRSGAIPEASQSFWLDFWLRKADVDLMVEALETLPRVLENDIVRMLAFRGYLTGTDERLLKLVVADLSSDVYQDQMWAQMLVRKDELFLRGFVQHIDSFDTQERATMLRCLRTIPSIDGELQQEIKECFDRESDERIKVLWLVLFGQFGQVDTSLIEWIDLRWTNMPDHPLALCAHFQHAFVEVMGRLLHRCEVSMPSVSDSDVPKRAFDWLRLRSLEGDQAIRKQARRWILSHPSQESRQWAYQVIEEGFCDPAMENRCDAFWCLYRLSVDGADRSGQIMETSEIDLRPGDRDMISELLQMRPNSTDGER